MKTLTPEQIGPAVREALVSEPTIDIHTHLFAPAFGTPVANAGGPVDPRGLMLFGIDELLTYHYLVAEVFRAVPAVRFPYERFWQLSRSEQADHIWKALFLDRAPISEATTGVITCLTRLGLDPNTDSLARIRGWFAEQDPSGYVDRVMELAHVQSITMTNEVFDDNERERWLRDPEALRDPRFSAVLRLDPLILDWPASGSRLASWGYRVEPDLGGASIEELRRFLREWIERMHAIYLAASLPPEWRFPAGDGESEWAGQRILEEAILPVCRERGLPWAMMIGSRRAVNPELRGAGDMGGHADIQGLVRLCRHHPQNKFLVTMLSRENQHELVVTARKFGNLMVFGCWWFVNNPSIVTEITAERFEMLGTSFIPQHSDARILDQLLYKWDNSRAVVGRVLAEKYADLVRAGWRLTREQVDRDVRHLFHDNFLEFLER